MRNLRCASISSTQAKRDRDACVGLEAGVREVIRSDALGDLMRCAASDPCTVRCEDRVAGRLAPLDSMQGFDRELAAKGKRCGEDFGFDSSGNGLRLLMSEGYWSSFAPCFALDCAQVTSCIAQKHAAIAPRLFFLPHGSSSVGFFYAPDGPRASVVPFAPLPASLTCEQGVRGPRLALPGPSSEPPVVAGPMTEQAAAALRLFDQEDWARALQALQRVAAGETGDDLGNRQTAEYRAAIALYRLGRLREARAVFSRIARTVSHAKHRETLFWLLVFAPAHPELVDLTAIAQYTPDEGKPLDNPMQRELYGSFVYFLGRARLQNGSAAQARELLRQVPANHPYVIHAAQCLERARGSAGGGAVR
ncbi:MAG: hypothetical protein JW940_18310 [Polyangiaceae bacterium]|nr:hypothetical protein [Polyangiaceae bacterium]